MAVPLIAMMFLCGWPLSLGAFLAPNPSNKISLKPAGQSRTISAARQQQSLPLLLSLNAKETRTDLFSTWQRRKWPFDHPQRTQARCRLLLSSTISSLPTEASSLPPEKEVVATATEGSVSNGDPNEDGQESTATTRAKSKNISGSTSSSRGRGLRGFVGSMLRRGLSYVTILTTWLLFRFLLKGLNRVECHNREALHRAVFDRGDRGLLTVSNHACVFDDPGLWSALVPFWRTGQKKMRWAMCTDDIYNADPMLRNVFDAGKTLPIKRSRGMEQPLFKAFFQKLEQGEWGHIFAEGAIRQPWRFSKGEPLLADFKAGIGRLLLRSEDPPLVLPMYHIGMHQVAPEAPVKKRGKGRLVKMLPNIGRKIHVYVGEPIDVSPIIEKCREKIGDVRELPWTTRSSKEEVECHKEIASFVREHVLKLEAVAKQDYYGDNPSSPYV